MSLVTALQAENECMCLIWFEFTGIRHNKVLSFDFFQDSKFLCENLYILQEFTLVLEMLI